MKTLSDLGLRRTEAPAATAAPSAKAVTPPAAAPVPDKRYLALRNFALSITVLNAFGYTVLGFEQPWLWPILAVLVAYAAELMFEWTEAWAQERAPRYLGRGPRGIYEFLLPAHITGLAANMLIYTNNQFLPVAVGVVAGVGSKYVIKAPVHGKMRHVMNPSNFGICVTFVMFSGWVSMMQPYQFSEKVNSLFSILILGILLVAGTLLNAALTNKIPLIVGWLGGFVIQALVRHWIFDTALLASLVIMTGIAFVLYTNYMITDPGTTPQRGVMQFMFGSGIAVAYGILMALNIVYTLFFALLVVCSVRYGVLWFVHWRTSLSEARHQPAAESARGGV